MYKILLVNPPVSVQSPKTAVMPLPCLILGRILQTLQTESLEFSFDLVDLDLMLKLGQFEDNETFYEKAATCLLEKSPDACFFSTHGVNAALAIQICQQIKSRCPDVLLVLGGVAATLQAKQLIERFEAVDVVIKGEAEPVLPELVRHALSDKAFDQVPSAVLRREGRLIDNPRARMNEKDDLPFPDYSLVDMEVYRKHNAEFPYLFPGFALIESGRGCQFNCRFCAPAKMWGQQVRYKSLDRIIEEMCFLKDRGFDFSFFTQDNLGVQFMRDLAAELIRRNVQIPWGGYARINQIDDETLDLVAGSGCKVLFVGLETPNKSSQKYVRKILDRSEMLERIGKFNAKGVKLICSFIAGFEGETEEEFANTLEFALECAASAKLQILKQEVKNKSFEDLPSAPVNFSTVHPLASMPGTDFAEDVKSALRLVPYTHHHDAYGSTLFGLDEFTKRNWEHIFTAFVTHLDDKQIASYYPILRLFNFLGARPFHLAWFLETRKTALLPFLRSVAAQIGTETILNVNMLHLERILSRILSQTVGADIEIHAERVAHEKAPSQSYE